MKCREGLLAPGCRHLFIPGAMVLIEVDAIPVLGTGKLD